MGICWKAAAASLPNLAIGIWLKASRLPSRAIGICWNASARLPSRAIGICSNPALLLPIRATGIISGPPRPILRTVSGYDDVESIIPESQTHTTLAPNLAMGIPPAGNCEDFLVKRRDPKLRTNHGP